MTQAAQVLEPEPIDLVTGALARDERAKDCRESFVEYFKYVGRTQSGQPLVWDKEMVTTAREAERAFFAGKDFVDEQGRKSAKSLVGWHFHAWLISKYPEMTVFHISCNDDYAYQRNGMLQDVLRSKPHIEVWGEQGRLYEKGSNQGQTTVCGNPRRNSNPNIVAKGVGGARAGKRADRLWADDCVDEKTSLAQPAMLEAIKRAFYVTIKKFLVDWRVLGHGIGRTGVGMIYYSGTPYAEKDLHDELVKRAKKNAVKVGGDDFAQTWENERVIYRRIAFGGPEDDFYSPMPKILSPETLAEEYGENARAYEMAYMLKAIGVGEKPFERILYWLPEKFKPYPEVIEDLGYCPVALPLGQWDSKARTWPRVMAVDPGFTEKRTSSFTGYVIGTLAPDNHIYILFANQVRKRWDKTQEVLIQAAKRWNVDTMYIEAAAQQISLVTLFRDHGIRHVEPISPNNQKKFLRAKDVSGEVNGGRVLLPGQVSHEKVSGRKKYSIGPNRMHTYGKVHELVDQMMSFPGIQFCDLMDAFVYCVQGLRERARPRAEAMDLPPVANPDLQRGWKNFADRAFGREPEPGVIAESLIFN